jgi:hypothetical protein
VSRRDKRGGNQNSAKANRKPLIAPGARPHPGHTPLRAKVFNPPDPTGKLVIQFGQFDCEGPWCISKITSADHVTLLNRIRSFESMTMAECFSTSGDPGKDYSLEDLPNDEATQRLVDLGWDDQDRISRLNIGGKLRLYGFRRGTERFYALWWDPNHEIWPSKLRNT